MAPVDRIVSDDELLLKAGQGDQPAFMQIYQRYAPLLYVHARKLLRDGHGAEDVVQEVFTNLWQKAGTMQISISLSAYLYRAVRNRIFDHMTHTRVRSDYLLSLQNFMEQSGSSTDDYYREKELAAIIESQVACLPEKMRLVFELSRKSELSYKEISTQLNISENTVKKQISNALKILRDKLSVSAGLLVVLLHR
jgi:RNA polymerase sigma-70 factor (ECF subfamily)